MEKAYILPGEFDARGDGAADDTGPLQAAIDFAAATGKTLYLTPGRYRTGPLTVRAGVAIKAEPTWDYGGTGRTVLVPLGAGQKCVLGMNEAFGSTLDGFCVSGEGLGEGMAGVLADRGAFPREDCFRMANMKVMGFSGHGMYLDSAWCFSMRHCMLGFNRGDGLRIHGWDAFIEDCWFSGNGGAGINCEEGAASVTLTGNRIEWNGLGGIRLKESRAFNITGNYIDRSGCAGISAEAANGKFCDTIAVTGNVIYRSGKDAQSEEDSCHMRFDGCVNLAVTANTMCVGRDDGWTGRYSPDFGMILGRLGASVVSGNTLMCGALRELIVDRGDHHPETVIEKNPGTLVPEGAHTGTPPHPLSIAHMMCHGDDEWYLRHFGKVEKK